MTRETSRRGGSGYPGDEGVRYDKLQLERAWAVPRPTDELTQYGGHSATAAESGVSGPIQWVSHVVIEVTDLDRSEAWYRDFMGFDVVGRNLTAEQAPHGVMRTESNQLLILVQTESVTLDQPGHSGTHNAFTMTPNEYCRLIDRVREWGYNIVNIRAQMQAYGQYTVNLTDPDDNKVEVNCIGPEANDILMPGTGIIDCGPVERYKVGDVKPFKDGNFFLVRLREGFIAMSRWCRHMNGIVVWQPNYWRFWCPYHGAAYDRRGTCIGGQPNLNALRLNPIAFSQEGHILVNTDEVIDRVGYDPSQAMRPPTGVDAR